ncbi:MAG: SH3 domain-containing protein [Firmicutes bacterium]|nr:SH3 domain-containing protein [Bacillota bacterium]
MTIIRSTFNRFGEFYNLLFYDRLHIHFIVRIIILLLVFWMIAYILAQIFRYIIAPAAILFYYKLMKKRHRARYYVNLSYVGMVRSSRKAALRLLIVCGAASTLWLSAFGLHHDHAVPVAAVNAGAISNAITDLAEYYASGAVFADDTHNMLNTGWPGAAAWPADLEIILYLNELGQQGTRLRSGPGIADYTVIEILWDNDLLVYLYRSYPDKYEEGLYWLRVLSPTGTEGYVSSQLVGIVGDS